MRDFLRAYLKHGLTDIRVVERKSTQVGFGGPEPREESVAARSGNGFVLATFSWKPGVLGVGRSGTGPDVSSRPITEAEYKKLTEGKRRIDTPKAIRALEKETKSRKGG
jgi:hypothetical protein